ncbi:hypothetical protein LB505_005386 [Fusarium chuoi]|nr:hypothetical protein LB505_005386 [Fusarium chuoi]
MHFDVLPKLWSWTGDLLLKWAPARFTGEISHTIVFVLTFAVISQLLRLPSSIYQTFVLEEEFDAQALRHRSHQDPSPHVRSCASFPRRFPQDHPEDW